MIISYLLTLIYLSHKHTRDPNLIMTVPADALVIYGAKPPALTVLTIK